MAEPTLSLDLPIVDGRKLPPRLREALRPGESIRDARGATRTLPRFFYRIDSWETAREQGLAPSFGLYEFIHVDLHEARILQRFPRYVPCAVTVLAAHLALLRQHVGTYVHVAANGGYRSPAHRLAEGPDLEHCWGTAAKIYRVGDDFLDREETIDKYRALIHELLPGVWTRPYGHGAAESDDHVHLSLGYINLEPPGSSS